MRVQSNKANRIAFAITITKDGNFQDGAAVLAYSIYKAFRPHRSSYKISLVAFVHPGFFLLSSNPHPNPHPHPKPVLSFSPFTSNSFSSFFIYMY
jgi:hypothetical protein